MCFRYATTTYYTCHYYNICDDDNMHVTTTGEGIYIFIAWDLCFFPGCGAREVNAPECLIVWACFVLFSRVTQAGIR